MPKRWSDPRTWATNEYVGARYMNQVRDELNHLYEGDGAITVIDEFQNGWEAWNLTQPIGTLNNGLVSYLKIGQHVQLQGAIKNGTIGSTTPAVMLPPHICPSRALIIPAFSLTIGLSQVASVVQIHPDWPGSVVQRALVVRAGDPWYIYFNVCYSVSHA